MWEKETLQHSAVLAKIVALSTTNRHMRPVDMMEKEVVQIKGVQVSSDIKMSFLKSLLHFKIIHQTVFRFDRS